MQNPGPARDKPALPEFDKPPVSEVAISIQFAPINGWTAAHGGVYWAGIRDTYPESQVYPPLPTQIEQFGDDRWVTPGISFEPMNPDSARFWYVNEDQTKIVQVQRDFFIVNWRQVKGDEKYPRYEAEMKPRFIKEFEAFQKFVADNKIEDVQVTQCELTYVNDIFQGQGWEKLTDAFKLFTVSLEPSDNAFLPAPHTLSLSAAFDMPDHAGRLHIQGRHVRRLDDRREAFQFKLTARGKPKSSAMADIIAWMDMGREWIVRGFAETTSADAHKLWGRTR